MRFDWSKILIVAMGAFIIMIVSMGIRMATSNQALYEDDYYELGENHTDRMHREEHARFVNVDLNANTQMLTVSFDSTGYCTRIRLVYLADKSQDKTLEKIDGTSSPSQQFNVGEIRSGSWFVEVSGNVNGNDFFVKEKYTL